MEEVLIEPVNETYVRIVCEPSTAYELSDYFTFDVPGAKFMPSFKNKIWDGKIRLYNTMTRLLYAGLVPYVNRFCGERNYNLVSNLPVQDHDFRATALEVLNELQLKFEPRDYQIDAYLHGVKNNRALFLSPTASGKSLIIYLLTRYHASKTLIIVPTTSLVHQMASDFETYGLPDADDHIHKIFSGQEKKTDKLITITTWQSIYKNHKNFYADYKVVIGDEAHLFKANSLTSIMTKLDQVKYRYGFTGTLDGTQTHKLVLEGLFGVVKQVTTTADLIEQKHLSQFKIKAIVLKYSDEIRKQIAKSTYQQEIDFLVSNDDRNKIIRDLTLSLKGNTLLLFNLVERHGQVLHDMITSKAPDREIYFIHGGIDGEIRNEIRAKIEESENAIIIASYGTFSTGINIKNLHNIVFASPSKSRIRNLQSIGRGLRKSDKKDIATLYDIADDLVWKTWKNHTIKHFVERIKIYSEEKFDYKIYNMEIK